MSASENVVGANGGAMRRPLRLAVLGSGRGSNLEAILSAIGEEILDANVVAVIADRHDARILKIAGKAGCAAIAVEGDPFPETDLLIHLAESSADLVILAGFMHIIHKPVLDAWPRRILNVHPSLLPKYPGLKAWQQALDAGETEAGCTVHLVDAGIDTGQILGQARVPVLPDDDPETLHQRIQEAEYKLYPQVIRDYGTKLLG